MRTAHTTTTSAMITSDVMYVYPVILGKCCEEHLSADELERAGRFKFIQHRTAFVAVRAALRSILARYLNCNPKEIRFRAGVHGKPSLEYPKLDIPLHFNVSHSNNYAVIAVTTAGAVGVDLEYKCRDIAFQEIANRFFSDNEQEWLATGPEAERKRDFFRLWVLKEAIIKAAGRGLSMSLREAEIVFTDRVPREMSGQWWVEELELFDNYAAAIACGRQCRLLTMDSYSTAG